MMKNPAPSSIAVAPPFYSNGRSGVELALEELAKNKKTLVPLEGGAKAAYSSSFLFLFFLSFEAQLLSLSLCQSLNLSDRVQCSKKSCRICPSLIFWMVKQAIDSKANENGLGNVGPGFHTCDKQHPVPAKKTALRDLQNSYRTVVPKTQGNSPFLKEKGPILDAIKVSGNKRPSPEIPPNPPCHQSLSSNGENGHLVYVRRKSELELGKSNVGSDASHPPPRKFSHDEQESPRQNTQMKESKISCFLSYAPIPMASLTTFSSGGPTVPLSLGKTGNGLLLRESENPIVTSGDSLMVNQRAPSESHWKERFLRLQTFLRNCDHSSQEEYIQMLRSLPPVGRSRHAVELEKRAIHLSLEEGKEVHRVTVLNVLGKSVTKSNALLSPQQPN